MDTFAEALGATHVTDCRRLGDLDDQPPWIDTVTVELALDVGEHASVCDRQGGQVDGHTSVSPSKLAAQQGDHLADHHAVDLLDQAIALGGRQEAAARRSAGSEARAGPRAARGASAQATGADAARQAWRNWPVGLDSAGAGPPQGACRAHGLRSWSWRRLWKLASRQIFIERHPNTHGGPSMWRFSTESRSEPPQKCTIVP